MNCNHVFGLGQGILVTGATVHISQQLLFTLLVLPLSLVVQVRVPTYTAENSFTRDLTLCF